MIDFVCYAIFKLYLSIWEFFAIVSIYFGNHELKNSQGNKLDKISSPIDCF